MLQNKTSTLNAILAKDLDVLSKPLLERALETAETNKDHNVVYFSTAIKLLAFCEITDTSPEQLVYDFPDGPKNSDSEKGCFSLLKSSMLFLDLPDKSFLREENDKLDIQHILKLAKILEKHYNLKIIIIDDIDAVACASMGREALWRTNAGNLSAFEDWKERRLEYLIALLFYISRKFEISVVFGKAISQNEKTPISEINLKQLFPINSFDMIDCITILNDSHQFSSS